MTEQAEAPSRLDRRKQRTREALLAAAQQFLADGMTNASIQQITDAADVGFGTFYNHFDSKEQLFEEAVAAALDTWGLMRDAVVEGIDDPAEIFATSYRMIGRVQRHTPELVRVLLNAGASVLITDRGIRPRALADLSRGIETGRFTIPDAELGLMAVGGALLGLLQMLAAKPDIDDASVTDAFTERVLLMLGIDGTEARRLVTLPLPDIASVT